MKKNALLKLRNLLLNFKDMQTEEGVTLIVDNLEVGVEVFTYDENGDIVPAADGNYTWENKVITVGEGVIKAIVDKEIENPETPAEETPAEETPAEEEASEEEAPAEEETPAEEEVDKDAKIAELEARIAELEAENTELEAENTELKAKLDEPAGESADEEFKNQNHEEVELTAQEKAANIVKFIKNRKK